MARDLGMKANERSHAVPISRLSEENLLRHNVESQKVHRVRHHLVDQNRADQTQASGTESYDQAFGNMEDLDMDAEMHENETALRRKASIDVLKLYNGALASLTTPMRRLVDANSTPKRNLWMVRNMMVGESRMAVGEAETLELRTLVSDMVFASNGACGLQNDTWDVARGIAGSPRPDSDTLSNPDISELMSEVKIGRHQQMTGIGKRSRMDSMAIPRSIPTSAMG